MRAASSGRGGAEPRPLITHKGNLACTPYDWAVFWASAMSFDEVRDELGPGRDGGP